MSVGRVCSRVVATAAPEESVTAGAVRMAEYGVGSLVVVDGDLKPTGILTDRDVALRTVGAGLDPGSTPVSQVMSTPVRSVDESTPIEEALAVMERGGVRRLVVTGEGGALAGIFALDDALELLSEEMARVGRILEKQGRDALPD